MAEHDGKVVFDLELDDHKVKADLNKALTGIKKQAAASDAQVKINVTADVKAAETALKGVKASAQAVEQSHATVTVDADTSSANTLLEGTKNKANDVEQSDPTVTVAADTTAANRSLESTQGKATQLGVAKPEVVATANTASADTDLDTTQGKADVLGDSKPEVVVTANTAGANRSLDSTQGKATELGLSKPEVVATANTSSADTNLDTTQEKAADLGRSKPEVVATANTAGANRSLDSTQGKATQLGLSKPEVVATANTSSADTDLDTTQEKADDLGKAKPIVTATANTTGANRGLDTTQGKATQLGMSKPEVVATANTSAADTNLETTQQKATKLGGSKPEVVATANTTSANTDLSGTQARANNLGASKPEVVATANTSSADTNLETTQEKADKLAITKPVVSVTADTASAVDALNDVGTAADDAKSKWESLKSSLKEGIVHGIGQSIGQSIMGAAGNAISGIFSAGQSYEVGLAKASTLMPSHANRDVFGASLLGLSSETGQDIGTLTEAAYNALSASMDFGGAGGGTLIDYLRTASKLAVGGFSDTNSAATAMAKTINAYNMTTADAEKVANIMIKTQNRGITDVDKLSQSLSHVTAIAATSGVSFEQIGAMLSTITAQGVETSEATTQSRALISELVKSDTTANKNMKAALQGTEWAGKSFQEIMEGGGNIADVVSAIDAYATKTKKSMVDMFSSQEAANAATMLLAGNGTVFKSNLAYMQDSTNVVDEAYTTMADTTTTALAKIHAQFESYGAMLYKALAPGLMKLAGIFEGEDFKLTMARLINQLTGVLEGDAINNVIDGLTNAAQTLLDLFSGKITVGELLGGALKSAGDWLWDKLVSAGEALKGLLIDAANTVIEWMNGLTLHLPGILGGDFHPFNIGHIKGGSSGNGDFEIPAEAEGAGRPGWEAQYEARQRAENAAAVLDKNFVSDWSTYQTIAAASTTEKAELDAAIDTLREALPDSDAWWNTPIEVKMPETITVSAATLETTAKRGDDDSKTGGTAVTDLQTVLTQLGYAVGAIDGIFGKNTQGAVESYQKDNGLEVTGELDDATMAALNASIEAMNTSTESASTAAASANESMTATSEALTTASEAATATSESATATSEALTAASEAATAQAESQTAVADTTQTIADIVQTAVESATNASTNTSTAATNLSTLAANAGTAATNAGTAASSISGVASAFSGLIARIASIQVPTRIPSFGFSGGGGGGKSGGGSFGVGLDIVPYDNYPALLHRGEMVLNAAEASAYRNREYEGGGSGSGIDYARLAAAMSGMTVEMDGKTVGRLVERSVSRAQSDRYRRASRKG